MAARGRPPKPETVIARQVAQALKSIEKDVVQGVSTTRVNARYDAAGHGRRLTE